MKSIDLCPGKENLNYHDLDVETDKTFSSLTSSNMVAKTRTPMILSPYEYLVLNEENSGYNKKKKIQDLLVSQLSNIRITKWAVLRGLKH